MVFHISIVSARGLVDITIYGNIPPKKNSKQIIRNGSRAFLIPSQSYKEWHKEQCLLLKKQVPKKPIEHCFITATFYFIDNRKRDMSNMVESVNDLLVDMGFIKDDCWQVLEEEHLIAGGVDKKNPRCEIEIYEI